MFRNMLLVIISIFFAACATWQGVKEDSKTAWETTKETTSQTYKGVKKSIHNATAE